MRLILLIAALLSNRERPDLRENGIVSAADGSSGRVTPGEILYVFSPNTGPATLARVNVLPTGRVATTLADTRVFFDEIAAPVHFATRGQVATVVPFEIANHATTRVAIEYRGVRSEPVTLPVVRTAPALFTLDSSGHGQAAMLNETGCCNSAQNPAARGSIVAFYGTGAGQTTPKSITGRVIPFTGVANLERPRFPVTVTIGGKPAEVLFAGQAPHAVSGLLQINVRVPAT